MCFAFDASPPHLPADLARPPLAGGAGPELLELTSADGTTFSAALAEAPDAKPVGVVVLPDVRGLYAFYSELTERFAQAGHHAIALDYFGRTAGLGPREEDFDYWPEMAHVTLEGIQADAAAGAAALRERTGVERVAAVGFCFGGAMSFLGATSAELGLDRAVGFYGGLDGSRFGLPSAKDEAPRARCPVLGLFGGADQGIPPDQIERFDRGLDEAGVEHAVVTYPGAPHSFFDRHQAEHADASADAWRRTLAFLDAP